MELSTACIFFSSIWLVFGEDIACFIIQDPILKIFVHPKLLVQSVSMGGIVQYDRPKIIRRDRSKRSVNDRKNISLDSDRPTMVVKRYRENDRLTIVEEG